MKKIALVLAALFAAVIFVYGSLAALVHQGLGLFAAVLVFFAVLLGGLGIVMLVGKNPAAPRDPQA
jgi:hypothetical protein